MTEIYVNCPKICRMDIEKQIILQYNMNHLSFQFQILKEIKVEMAVMMDGGGDHAKLSSLKGTSRSALNFQEIIITVWMFIITFVTRS